MNTLSLNLPLVAHSPIQVNTGGLKRPYTASDMPHDIGITKFDLFLNLQNWDNAPVLMIRASSMAPSFRVNLQYMS